MNEFYSASVQQLILFIEPCFVLDILDSSNKIRFLDMATCRVTRHDLKNAPLAAIVELTCMLVL